MSDTDDLQKAIAEAKARGLVPVECPDAMKLYWDKKVQFTARDAAGNTALLVGKMMVFPYPFTAITVVFHHSLSPRGPIVEEKWNLEQATVNLLERSEVPEYAFRIPPSCVFVRLP